MSYILYPESQRGRADHGWLQARHTFSFSSWYDPQKIHFGALRVLNDDRVAPGMGFGMHPHDNMEIVTIPLSGGVHHRDSMGNQGTIHPGEIQVMSAGSGITHSEINASKEEDLTLFQIWIFPDTKDVEPRYDQWNYSEKESPNQWTTLVAPKAAAQGSWIHQDVWMKIGSFDSGTQIQIDGRGPGYGQFIMVVEGQLQYQSEQLGARDAIGIQDETEIRLQVLSNARILLIDLPMQP